MFGLGTGEIIIILVVGFMLFGPHKLVNLAQRIGRFIRKFKQDVEKAEKIDLD